jgi:Fe-S cluster assembly iron-binding protein IscA
MTNFNRYILIFAAFGLTLQLQAQGTAFIFKGGLTVGTQRWNGADASRALFSYHGAAAAEFLGGWKTAKNSNTDVKNSQTSFGIQAGFHRKGNAIRVRFQDPQDPNRFVRYTLKNQFDNVSVVLYAKGARLIAAQSEVYYLLGLRLDYTVQYSMLMQGYDNYVNKFNYGVTLGGGYTYYIPKTRLGLFVEASISPDISRQIYVPAGIPVQYQIDGITYSYPSQELKVNNLIFEISVGLKLLPPVYEATPDDIDIE